MDAVTGLAGGFVAAEGAMLLFNSESEALEETLRRVGGALALTSGLRDLANGVIAMRKFGLAAKIATARQWALNVAMNANPIGSQQQQGKYQRRKDLQPLEKRS
jgi:hypothetical protein